MPRRSQYQAALRPASLTVRMTTWPAMRGMGQLWPSRRSAGKQRYPAGKDGCGVASIERIAYPRFKRFLSARELRVFYTPQLEEIAWAKSQVRSAEHLLALMVQLKCFNRMGHFPSLDDVPDVVVAHIRRDLGLGEDVAPVYDSDRTRKSHRTLIRRRSGVVSFHSRISSARPGCHHEDRPSPPCVARPEHFVAAVTV